MVERLEDRTVPSFTINEFALPTPNNLPNHIVGGPDGNVWFMETNRNALGRITPTGQITEIALPVSGGNVSFIFGPDGNIWIGGYTDIAEITQQGALLHDYAIPSALGRSNQYGNLPIVFGPDGNIWYTEPYVSDVIGRLTPGGQITEYHTGLDNNGAAEIINGPDGNIWFDATGTNTLGKITAAGDITLFSNLDSTPFRGLTSGPNGNLWMTTSHGTIDEIGTAAQVIASFSDPNGPYILTQGSDGNLWFTESGDRSAASGGGQNIGSITPQGTITEYPIPTANSGESDITVGTDGNIWFSEYAVNQIGKVVLRPTPSPYLVWNTADSGPGSLRDAITQVNADTSHSLYTSPSDPSKDEIDFAIGSGVQTITPLSALPAITNAVLLDGRTQPGFAGKPMIELNGSGISGDADGLDILGNGITVRGLIINRFSGTGIVIVGNNNIVAGNYIGTDVSGTIALGNNYHGLVVGVGPSADSSNNTIGGATAIDRNLISGNAVRGIYLAADASHAVVGTLIEGNYIGTDITGNMALGHVTNDGRGLGNGAEAISVSGNVYNTEIGGLTSTPGTGPGNVIVNWNYFLNPAITIWGGFPFPHGTIVQGNCIGVGASGVPLNITAAIWIRTGTDNMIGGTMPGAANLIGGYASGVLIETATARNTIRRNSIFTSGGLGIDLAEDGVTLNDSADHTAAGANYFQNFPVLASAFTNGTTTTITGSFSEAAEPNTVIALDFYANAVPNSSGYGQGQTYLGSASVPTDGGGNANFPITLQVAVPAGQWVTATATDPAGNTSEFARDVQVVRQVATTTTLTSSANPSIPGQPVTFTATVTPTVAVNATPTGTVDFLDTTSNIDLGTAALSPSGVATLTPTTPLSQLGTHVIQANYIPSPGSFFLASSGTTNQAVTQSVYVLNLTANGAVNLSNSAGMTIPGNLVVDSNSKNAVTESNTAQITAASIQVVGGASLSGKATISPAPTKLAAAIADPLAGLTAPTASGTPVAVSLTNSSPPLTLNPGVYSAINVSGKNASLTMNPGVYIVQGGGFAVTSGGSVTGNGVVIYNTANAKGNFGGITLSGSGTFGLSAPTTGPYAGVLIFQDRTNTRAVALGGTAATQGINGTIYARAAQLALSNAANVNGALVLDSLSLSGSATSTLSVDGAGSSAGTAGQLLAGNLLVYVHDPNGLFTADEQARIQDAVHAVDRAVEPYGVSVTETSDSGAANVIVDMGTTTAAGGYADGVLGCYTSAGEITLVQGWNWYAGSDAGAVGSGQYDFETAVVHELGHAVGLGHSADPTSVMYATLAAGVAERALWTADLAIPDYDADADALHAAVNGGRVSDPPYPEMARLANPPYEAGRDMVFASLGMQPAGLPLGAAAGPETRAQRDWSAESSRSGDLAGDGWFAAGLASDQAFALAATSLSGKTSSPIFAGRPLPADDGWLFGMPLFPESGQDVPGDGPKADGSGIQPVEVGIDFIAADPPSLEY